MLTKYSN